MLSLSVSALWTSLRSPNRSRVGTLIAPSSASVTGVSSAYRRFENNAYDRLRPDPQRVRRWNDHFSEQDHLDNSLKHLSDLVAKNTAP